MRGEGEGGGEKRERRVEEGWGRVEERKRSLLSISSSHTLPQRFRAPFVFRLVILA